jgi:hypothetical protein
MIRLLFALVVILNSTAFAQDTLAVVETKLGGDEVEVFFSGDTTLIRVPNSAGKTAKRGSTAVWYVNGQKVGDADLSSIRSHHMLGIKQHDTITYLYAFEKKGKNSIINIYRSDNFGPSVLVSTTTVPGVPSMTFDLGGKTSICFWERRGTTVHIVKFERDRVLETIDIKIPINLKTIRDEDVVFVIPGDAQRISGSAYPLKLFIDGEMFCALFDDSQIMFGNDASPPMMTHLYRKNLRTGEEDIDVFAGSTTHMFKSFVLKNHIYRFTSDVDKSRLVVYDVDKNKQLSEFELTKESNPLGIERLGKKHRWSQRETLGYGNIIRIEAIDVGIIVDDNGPEKIIALGFVDHKNGQSNVYTPFYFLPIAPVLSIGGTIAATYIKSTIAQLKDDARYTLTTYLHGSPEGKFEIVNIGETHHSLRLKVDDYDLRNPPGDLCYSAYFAQKDYWLGVYRLCGSPRYVVLKFNKDGMNK